jgi:ribonuclease P protein component
MALSERQSFLKCERLYREKEIDRLFADGQSFISYPLRIAYLSDTGDASPISGISVLISVPKKHIRQAVYRNRVKRLVRESFRLNRNEISDLYEQTGKQLHIAFIYICKEIKPYACIRHAMLKALKTIRLKELA